LGGNPQKHPLLWHFRFGGPDMERLVAGRERIYLDRFWNEFSADPKKWDEASRRALRRSSMPIAWCDARSGFAQFAAFDQDVDRQQGVPWQRVNLHHAGP
jgi:hypothetical protein